MGKKISIVHLSDFHFVSSNDQISHYIYSEQEEVWDLLVKDVVKEIEKTNSSRVFFVVTGDLSLKGQKDELILASKRLKKLTDPFGNLSELLIVPGNHDANWSGDKYETKLLIKDICNSEKGKDEGKFAGNFRDGICTSKSLHKRFSFYWKTNFGDSGKWKDGIYTYQCPNTGLGFVGLNTAWTCSEDYPLPYLTEHYLREAIQELEAMDNTEYRVLLLHHPVWEIKGLNIIRVNRELQKHVNIIFHGHLHEAAVINNQTPESSTLVIPSAALFAEKRYKAYGIVTVEMKDGIKGSYTPRICQDVGGFPVFVPFQSLIPLDQGTQISFLTDEKGHIRLSRETIDKKRYADSGWRRQKARSLVDLIGENHENGQDRLRKMFLELWDSEKKMLKRGLDLEAMELASLVYKNIVKKNIEIDQQYLMILQLLEQGVHKAYPRVFDLMPAQSELDGLMDNLLDNPRYCICLLGIVLVGKGRYEEALKTIDISEFSGDLFLRSLAHYLRGYSYRKRDELEPSDGEMIHSLEQIEQVCRGLSKDDPLYLRAKVLEAQAFRGKGVITRKKYMSKLKENKKEDPSSWKNCENNYKKAIQIIENLKEPGSDEARYPLAFADIHYSTGYFMFESSIQKYLSLGKTPTISMIHSASEYFQDAIQYSNQGAHEWDAPYCRLAITYQIRRNLGDTSNYLDNAPSLYFSAITASNGPHRTVESPLTKLLCYCGLVLEDDELGDRIKKLNAELKELKSSKLSFAKATLNCHIFDIQALKLFLEPDPIVKAAIEECVKYLSSLKEKLGF